MIKKTWVMFALGIAIEKYLPGQERQVATSVFHHAGKIDQVILQHGAVHLRHLGGI